MSVCTIFVACHYVFMQMLVINHATYRNSFDIQLTVSDRSVDCTRFRCSTSSVDMYWAKQYAMRVTLAHSSTQSGCCVSVPISEGGSAIRKLLHASVLPWYWMPKESDVFRTEAITVGSELSSMPCAVWSWAQLQTESVRRSQVILVRQCMHCCRKSTFLHNGHLLASNLLVTSQQQHCSVLSSKHTEKEKLRGNFSYKINFKMQYSSSVLVLVRSWMHCLITVIKI